MQDKVFLITGCSGGIGKEAAVRIAKMKAHVVIVCRNRERGEPALAEIRSRSGSAKVDLLTADFGHQASIREMSSEFLSRYDRLDVLINNAGAIHRNRELSADGIEKTFAINHLGYFLLTNLLLERIKQASPSRIVVVASNAHRSAKWDWNNLQGERKYHYFGAYCISKLANVLFTNALARRLAGSGVTINAVHPGEVQTGIVRQIPPLFAWLFNRIAITAERGSDGLVHLATSDTVEGQTGKYFEKMRETRPSPLSQDTELSEKLWELSEKLTGLTT